MSKTIDVRKRDGWTKTSSGDLWQFRDGKCRLVYSDDVAGWEPSCILSDEVPVSFDEASESLIRWGYTLTRDEGKVEGGTEAKPADVPPGEQIIAVLASFRDSLKPADVVDAVWVEVEYNGGNKELLAYPSPDDAKRLGMDGRISRIVRVRSVDEEARKRLSALESRLAAVESIANCKGIYIPAEKPADKPAARVVLPGMSSHYSEMYRFGWASAINEVKAALASQGIKVEAAE